VAIAIEADQILHKEGGITRVVLDLGRPVQVVASQIPNPDRFMIDAASGYTSYNAVTSGNPFATAVRA